MTLSHKTSLSLNCEDMDLTDGSISKWVQNWLDGCTQRVLVNSE